MPTAARPATLLRTGNQKLGSSIGTFSLPAVETCPGLTSTCAGACYARAYSRRFHIDYTPELEASKAEDFISRMQAEARWKAVVRVHVSGDFVSPEYIRKWLVIASGSPRTLFFGYTRSWRLPNMRPLLQELQAMDNFRLMWSCDRQTGIPEWMQESDVAWLAMSDTDFPAAGRKPAVVFRKNQNTIVARMNRAVVCPAENGVDNSVTCQKCTLCFREKL